MLSDGKGTEGQTQRRHLEPVASPPEWEEPRHGLTVTPPEPGEREGLYVELTEDYAALRSTRRVQRHGLRRRRRPRGLVAAVVVAVVGGATAGLWFGWIAPSRSGGQAAEGENGPVAAAPAAADDALVAEIRRALTAAGLGHLEVAVEDGRATVTGPVPDEASRATAAATVLAVSGVTELDNGLFVGTVADPVAAALAALAGEAYAQVAVEVEGGVAVLRGTVPSEQARLDAGALVLGIDGVDKVDNRLEVAAGPVTPAADLEAAALAALREAGFAAVTVTVRGTEAVLEGVVPEGALEAGFFAYTDAARQTVLSVEGIEVVTSRLHLKGDEGLLRRQLQELTEAAPILFASGSSELTAESRTTLDEAALLILANPRLPILIAGRTDPAGDTHANEHLSRNRALAVYTYLVERGVSPERLSVVAYGEIFHDPELPAELYRSVALEVGA